MADPEAAEAARDARNERLGDLIARTALTDQRAFAELYRLTASHLFGVSLRIVRDRAVAEEILQEVYVNVWNHAGSYAAARSRALTWLTAVARNRCLDHVRHRDVATISLSAADDNEGAVQHDPPSSDPSPAELLISGADAHSVRECVDRLEGPTRQAIALAFFEGLSHAELAVHLGEPLGTVKSWVRRGLARLKRCLDTLGVTA